MKPGLRTISIQDNGIGITESDLKSIFAHFYRGLAGERNCQTGGRGLGLSIVADCVDALKGDIHVEATLAEGTTFLPRVACRARSLNAKRKSRNAPHSA